MHIEGFRFAPMADFHMRSGKEGPALWLSGGHPKVGHKRHYETLGSRFGQYVADSNNAVSVRLAAPGSQSCC
jgi:hypothetical protein